MAIASRQRETPSSAIRKTSPLRRTPPRSSTTSEPAIVPSGSTIITDESRPIPPP